MVNAKKKVALEANLEASTVSKRVGLMMEDVVESKVMVEIKTAMAKTKEVGLEAMILSVEEVVKPMQPDTQVKIRRMAVVR